MKEQIQKFGRSLSAMVMPNIGAFIAWGLITAIFMNGGWWPNESIAKLITPMLNYLLPLLIAYTGGKNVGGVRGGVAGAVATMGVIVGTSTPMFIGAMIMGPLAGFCMKLWDKHIQHRVPAGFEMLVDNFSLGIIAMLLAILGYLVIGVAVQWITDILSFCVNFLLRHGLNPLLSLVVDPAKVLFLNNAVNHGIMTPLGIEQVHEIGHSMLFLVDPNPGPGLGILLACWVFGKGSTKSSAPGAAVIQIFGGIHEIYFPYVLARPILLLAVIAGNMCALSFFTVTDFGLLNTASPGSLISIILMSPPTVQILGLTVPGALVGTLGVIIGTGISFLVAIPMVKSQPDFNGEDAADASGASVAAGALGFSGATGIIRKIVFACDAGMGSSALGATRFKARLMKINKSSIICINSAIEQIPADADVVVCQNALADRARTKAPGKEVIALANFLKDPALDALLARIQVQDSAAAATATAPVGTAAGTSVPDPSAMLMKKNILVGLPSETKEAAIRRAGELLAASGYTDATYADAMLERERLTTTYMGMGLAIPHGTSDAKQAVKHSGIVVLQYPDGVIFNGEQQSPCDIEAEKAHLIVGIAGVGDEHLTILAKVAEALEDESLLEHLSTTGTADEIFGALS